jgi:hypothetical protein
LYLRLLTDSETTKEILCKYLRYSKAISEAQGARYCNSTYN